MNDDARRKEIECRARLYAQQNEPFAVDLLAMLNAAVERAKTSLLTADAGEVVKLQGKCAGYRDVIKWLTEPVNLPVDKV